MSLAIPKIPAPQLPAPIAPPTALNWFIDSRKLSGAGMRARLSSMRPTMCPRSGTSTPTATRPKSRSGTISGVNREQRLPCLYMPNLRSAIPCCADSCERLRHPCRDPHPGLCAFYIEDAQGGNQKYIQGHFVPKYNVPGSTGSTTAPNFGALTFNGSQTKLLN